MFGVNEKIIPLRIPECIGELGEQTIVTIVIASLAGLPRS